MGTSAAPVRSRARSIDIRAILVEPSDSGTSPVVSLMAPPCVRSKNMRVT
eukprot:COSAG05_NODE_16089_length_353_cov_4.617257_1_plen_49_part_10